MKALWLLLLVPFSVTAFGPGFAPATKPEPLPPRLWLDVKQFVDSGAADRTLVTNLMVDFSGHGFTFQDSTPTNTQYLTRFGGCISSGFAGNTIGLFCSNTFSNDAQTRMVTGPVGDTPFPNGKHTNQMTVAVRFNYRTGNGAVALLGNLGTGYGYAQLSGGTLFWDFGDGANIRLSKTQPGDMAGNWVNMFFTRSRTNQDVWMSGPDGVLTNWQSGLKTGLLRSGLNGNGGSGIMQLFSMGGLTNWYIKRYLIWDHELQRYDMEKWDRKMRELP